MGVQRKDERYKEELVDDISEGFNRAVGAKPDDEDAPAKPKFVITGDARATPPKRRRDR
jgi:hypothetical protein